MATNDKQPLRVLVVEEDTPLRDRTIAALVKEGFHCDAASNPENARCCLRETHYYVIVSDIIMPLRDGHALIVDLLKTQDRPLVVVFTGIADPRLMKDLLSRGVDDIIFKPLQAATLAAKVRCLIDRRLRSSLGNEPSALRKALSATADQCVAQREFENRLKAHLSEPSVSRAAIELFRLTTQASSNLNHVAAAAARIPTLSAEIVRLANSSSVNPLGNRIIDPYAAVSRLGLKRVGILALATAACASLGQDEVPFLQRQQVWQRSLAAGICLERLTSLYADPASYNESIGATVLQAMGRITLASVFPEVYEQLIVQAKSKQLSLAALESHTFPETTGRVAERVLESWGFPEEQLATLRYTSCSFAELSVLSDAKRQPMELAKLAGFLGDLTSGQFEDWDTVDFPPADLLKRLNIEEVDLLLTQCREPLPSQTSRSHELYSTKHKFDLMVSYHKLHDSIDFLPQLLGKYGIQLVASPGDTADAEEVMLVNALGLTAIEAARRLQTLTSSRTMVLTDATDIEPLQSLARVITLPSNLGLLRKTCADFRASGKGGQAPRLSAPRWLTHLARFALRN